VLRTAIVLVVGTLAPLLDSTMVNVAIHTIAADMKATISVVQWVTTGYVLAMGLAVPISGWTTKRFGSKRSYIFSLTIFLIGSICTMISWNIESMIAFHGVQGFGAGLLMPTMQTELVQVSVGRNIGRIMSIISIPGLLGPYGIYTSQTRINTGKTKGRRFKIVGLLVCFLSKIDIFEFAAGKTVYLNSNLNG
jgi:Arabinose efflux permease